MDLAEKPVRFYLDLLAYITWFSCSPYALFHDAFQSDVHQPDTTLVIKIT